MFGTMIDDDKQRQILTTSFAAGTAIVVDMAHC